MNNKLKKLRQEKGITQEQCSNDTGIPLRTLKRYESGGNIGDVNYIKILAIYYNVRIEDII